MEELNQIIALLQENEKKLKDKIKGNSKLQQTKLDKYFLWVLCCIIGISISGLIISKIFDCPIMAIGSLIVLLVGYLWFLFYPCFLLYRARKEIAHTFNYPFTSSLNVSVLNKIDIDKELLIQLETYTPKNCELALLELEHERKGIENRQCLLLGSINKIGILPGLIASFTMVITLNIGSLPSTFQGFIIAIAYTNLMLQLFPIFMYGVTSQYDRMIALLNLRLNKNS